jgi:hypothetical protein
MLDSANNVIHNHVIVLVVTVESTTTIIMFVFPVVETGLQDGGLLYCLCTETFKKNKLA